MRHQTADLATFVRLDVSMSSPNRGVVRELGGRFQLFVDSFFESSVSDPHDIASLCGKPIQPQLYSSLLPFARTALAIAFLRGQCALLSDNEQGRLSIGKDWLIFSYDTEIPVGAGNRSWSLCARSKCRGRSLALPFMADHARAKADRKLKRKLGVERSKA